MDEIGLLQELKCIGILEEPFNKILKEHEVLNIEIPSNKLRFLDYFTSILNEKYSYRKRYSKKEECEPAFRVGDEGNEKRLPDEVLLIGD